MRPLQKLETSARSLTYSNGIRRPTDDGRIPPPFPRSRPEDIRLSSKPDKEPRIPKPSSPTHVDLHAVADISAIVPLALRTLDIPNSREDPTVPETLAPPEDPISQEDLLDQQDLPTQHGRQRRRRTSLDYKTYHATGKKTERTER